MLRSIHVVCRAATAARDIAPLARSLLPHALRAPSTASTHQITAASSPPSQWRGYATRGRPKAGKTTTSSARSKPKTTAKRADRSKKAAAKPKPRKKVLTERQKAAAAKKKERDELKQLKEKALMHTEPKRKPDNSWTVFYSQQQSTGGKVAERARAASAQFKALSATELEQYNHQASENKRANETAYADWVSQHTPEQVRIANNARAQLRRKLANGKKSKRSGHGFSPIKDERQVKRPTNAFFKFNTERQHSGDLKNIQLTEAMRMVKMEWDALSEGEKKKYEDLAIADKQRYAREFNTIYGHPPPSAMNGPHA